MMSSGNEAVKFNILHRAWPNQASYDLLDFICALSSYKDNFFPILLCMRICVCVYYAHMYAHWAIEHNIKCQRLDSSYNWSFKVEPYRLC